MKSANPDKNRIQAFWLWFDSVANELAANLENTLLLQKLDQQVTELHSEVSWEIGPGFEKDCLLTISPNLNLVLLPITREIVSTAPKIEKWEFYPARQAKAWNYQVEVEANDGSTLSVDASAWTYVLLKHPDGDLEILIESSLHLPPNDDLRWQIGAIVLESIIGEELLLEKLENFEVVDRLEPKLREQRKPIKELQNAFLNGSAIT